MKMFVAIALLMGLFAVAQENPNKPDGFNDTLTDDPANNIQADRSPFAAGDVLGTVPIGTAGGTPVGLEAANGGLWVTDIANDEVAFQDLSGTVSFNFTGIGTPIGVSTDGSNIVHTDTASTTVQIFDSAGNNTGSFDVSNSTTFPEGITYKPDSGTWFVVSGSGENHVGEYTGAGALVTTYPITGSSQDGIQHDGMGFFYVYDSGTDTISRYSDDNFTVVEQYAGTATAGFSTGEGLGFADNVVYVLATGSGTIVAFDAARIDVPTLTEMGLIAMVGLMLMASLVVMRRRQTV